jgi:hemolysin activation/secretion protein
MRATRGSRPAEWRRSKTFLLGSGFSFVEGPDDGEAEVSVLRFGWQRLGANERRVLASRVQMSVGVNAFGATIDGDRDVPDGRFAALLGQVQWAERLPWWSSQLIARFDAQLTNDPLLGLEQISLGGRATVRGYREDTLIRDEGFVFSLEWRVPVWSGGGVARAEVRPFFDWSRSWNIERDEVGPGTLKSVGLGVYVVPMKGVDAELYWGYALNELDYASEYDIQDDGFHFRVRWET